MNRRPVLHLIANAHLDPVWLWDRAEGMAEISPAVQMTWSR